MPTVPRRDPSLMPTAPLPGVRVQPSAPAGAFGGQRQTPDLSGLQRQASELVEREQLHADQIAVLDADNQLARLQDDTLNNQETGILQRRGKNALGAPEDFNEAWRTGVSAIGAGLTTERQQEAFHRQVAQRYETAHGMVQRHVAGEIDQYDKETTNSAIGLMYNDAIASPDAGGRDFAIAKTKAALADYGRRQGWDAATVTEKQQTAVSRIHAGVIDRLIANRQDLDAVAYLTEHRPELAGNELAQAESLVAKGSVLGASQRAADGILKGAATLRDALDRAGQIADPNVREETEQRVRRSFEDKAAAEREDRQNNEIEAGQIIRKTGHYDQIPVRLLAKLTPNQIDGLKLLERTLTKKSSNPGTVLALRNLAGLHPEDFTREDLSQFRDQLSDADYDALAKKQLELRLGARRTENTARERQLKDLRKLEGEMHQSLQFNIPFDREKSLKIRALRDSVGVPPHGATVPGAPIKPPVGAPAKPPTSSAPLNITPLPKPPEHDGDFALVPSVPDSWLEHAQRDPGYADYLAAMGISV